MSLIRKKRGLPSLISSFFEGDNFLNSDWMGENKWWISEVPAANISEEDASFEIEVAVPGMKKEDFEITCEDGVLSIKAEKEAEEKEDKKNYTRREYNYSSFSRTFNLPESVDADNVSAKYEEGVLKLSIPKKDVGKSKPKKTIKIS